MDKAPPETGQLLELMAGMVSLLHGRQTAILATLQGMLQHVGPASPIAGEVRLQLERAYATQLAQTTNPPAIEAFERARDALLLALAAPTDGPG